MEGKAKTETSKRLLGKTLYRRVRKRGLRPIQQRGKGGVRELSTWRLRLEAGKSTTFEREGEEAILVLHEGAGRLACGTESWSVSRAGVFTEKATALFLPPGETLRVEASRPLEAVIVSTPAEGGGEPVLLGPEEVRVHRRGTGTYRREVHDLFVDDPHARRLMVGETFNPPGGWSSFPPHKHDGRDGEPRLEEVYAYRLEPPQGFGQQLLYTADGESAAHTVRDGDVVLLPYGYHPVAAAPGYRLYYLWALAGDQRRLSLYEDPDHRWIHEISDG